jgi:hypothetical protein
MLRCRLLSVSMQHLYPLGKLTTLDALRPSSPRSLSASGGRSLGLARKLARRADFLFS